MSTRRRLWDVDVRRTSSRQFPRRRGQRDVVVIVQTSTLEREVDVCVRSNYVTNGLPYVRSSCRRRRYHAGKHRYPIPMHGESPPPLQVRPELAVEPNVVMGLGCTRGAEQVDHAAEECSPGLDHPGGML